jgi:alpha-L-rhamnosidase
VSASGDVTNAEGLVDPAQGPTTLTMSLGGPEPTLLLDYGQDVGGLPYFTVSAASGLPILQAGFSEAERFAGPTGDMPATARVRFDTHLITTPGVVSDGSIQGGERFEYLTLTTPGSVTLSAVGIHFTAYRATPDTYQGYFLSSDDQLNRIWYAGAYTAQLTMAPAGSPDGGPQPVILDGAKRDRLVWIGDLAQTIPTIAATLGSNGTEYAKQSLALMARYQGLDGAVPGLALPTGPALFYSTSYSIYYVLDLAVYYRHTGDLAFARQQFPAVQRELAYGQSLVDPSTGLLTLSLLQSGDGLDWDPYDLVKTGAVTEYNALYHGALLDGADLADALGDQGTAARYRQQADDLRTAINAHLFNTTTGILATLQRTLWIAHGSLPFSADTGYSTLVSPFISGFELDARFAAGDTDGALTLLRNEWAPMLAPGPQYTGAFWENLNPDGSIPSGSTSLAHGWSSAPTSALTEYLLGVQPVGAGYRTWSVDPHPGDVAWARGQVPTAYGPITARWTRSTSSFAMEVDAPDATSGTITIPVVDPATAVVQVNGVVVWANGTPVGSTVGISAVRSSGAAVVLAVSNGGDYHLAAS